MAAIQILDDTDPSVEYFGGWQKAGSSNEYNGTTSWTNQPNQTATLSFIGIQISVVGTIGPRVSGFVSPQSSYSVDSGTPSIYASAQDQAVHYNTKFYTSPILPNGQHTIVVTNLLDSDTYFIDYFLISKSGSDPTFSLKPVTVTTTVGLTSQTSDAPAGTTKSSSNTGTIVGSALGAAVLVILFVALILWFRGRNRRNRDDSTLLNFRDDRETVPLALTPFSGGSQALISTSSMEYTPPGQVRNSSLPPPPGYTYDNSQLLDPVPATSNVSPKHIRTLVVNNSDRVMSDTTATRTSG